MTPGTKFNHWTIVVIQGRRATAQCRCGAIRQLYVASLLDGSASSSCGCAPRTASERTALLREEAEYAAMVEQRRQS